jgi:hypothetical protein
LYSEKVTAINTIDRAEMIITALLEHLDDDKDCPHCKHLLENIFCASHITEGGLIPNPKGEP